ncbi:hypothetical protein AVEN_19924-1, partial [Araneus ventricosus]
RFSIKRFFIKRFFIKKFFIKRFFIKRFFIKRFSNRSFSTKKGSSTPKLGRGGLVVRSRDLRVPGSKPDSTEDPPCMGPVAR